MVASCPCMLEESAVAEGKEASAFHAKHSQVVWALHSHTICGNASACRSDALGKDAWV